MFPEVFFGVIQGVLSKAGDRPEGFLREALADPCLKVCLAAPALAKDYGVKRLIGKAAQVKKKKQQAVSLFPDKTGLFYGLHRVFYKIPRE